ncbi:uncharacterized protein LOC111087723 [Limulus polyphemus]|uniref:Uncharacterized protein LOC111087723 n=1 Tax=Limulus polyphemus TaxID=6850 RepID=A0ABM1T5A5_LIMPO|nr:uncharacterized protein LOC111087723 [Limulus polyphemus]
MKYAAMPFLFPLSVVLVLCLITDVGDCRMGWMVFGSCILKHMGFPALLNKDVRCAANEMFKIFYKMTTRKCINCERYFYCQSNYNAVYNCGQNFKSIHTAEVISNCREFLQGGTDSRANQKAKRHGRRGWNCARKYLCAVNCKYNPSHGTCSLSNC